jgi:hypothetical protein
MIDAQTQPEELIRAALKDGCRAHCDSLIDELRRLHALNGELLEALKDLCSDDLTQGKWDKARAAIKAVEE